MELDAPWWSSACWTHVESEEQARVLKNKANNKTKES